MSIDKYYSDKIKQLKKDVAFHADDAIALREEVRRLDKENKRLQDIVEDAEDMLSALNS